MEQPRDRQFVKATLGSGEVVSARFSANHPILLAPGYEYHREERPWYCSADYVIAWEDDAANDPLGWDASGEPPAELTRQVGA